VTIGAGLNCSSSAGAIVGALGARLTGAPRSDGAYLSRASTRRTCDSSHCPFLLTVGTPRILSARATPFNDVAPAVCKAVMMGATSAALSLACFLRASRRCFLVEVTRLDGREVNLSQRHNLSRL
jgi:hypothetical protein